jgi:hypothetical protein
MSSNLSLLAGPDALRWIRERGLRGDDVDVVPGVSGGPKWLVLAGLDRVLFGGFFQGRSRLPVRGARLVRQVPALAPGRPDQLPPGRAWRQLLSESRRLGDELWDLLAAGKFVEHLRPL